MDRYDIIIVGTGIAGVSAAITAKVRKKNILLIGQPQLSEKLGKVHQILNYPGLPAVTGEQFAANLKDQLSGLDIEITPGRITLVYDMGTYFSVQTASNEFIDAESVIIASGVAKSKPYPGETEFLGRGVSYCATCDAPFYKGKTAAVIAASPEEEPEADFLAEYAAKVIYIPLYGGEANVRPDITVIREKPVSFDGEKKITHLTTSGGTYAVDGIFVLGGSIAPSRLVPGLETDGPHIKTDRQMQTNIPGIFACGDITGKPYQYAKAAGEGNVAALSAVEYLAAKKRNKK